MVPGLDAWLVCTFLWMHMCDSSGRREWALQVFFVVFLVESPPHVAFGLDRQPYNRVRTPSHRNACLGGDCWFGAKTLGLDVASFWSGFGREIVLSFQLFLLMVYMWFRCICFITPNGIAMARTYHAWLNSRRKPLVKPCWHPCCSAANAFLDSTLNGVCSSRGMLLLLLNPLWPSRTRV